MFSLDSNLKFKIINFEIKVSPTVTKFPKLARLILFVKQIRKNSIKNPPWCSRAANLTRVLILSFIKLKF
jgi:hypothetical protein